MLRNLDIMSRENSIVKHYRLDIEKYAKVYGIDPDLLKSVLSIEEFNRGSIIQCFIERLLINGFPAFVLRKDMSIGFGQIKISTASKLLSISEGAALEELAKPGRNIEICARYLRLLINKYLEYKKMNLVQ